MFRRQIRKFHHPTFLLVLILLVLATTATAAATQRHAPAEPADESPLFLPLLGNEMQAPLLPPTPSPLTPDPGLPLSRFETDLFSGPRRCHNCHADLVDESGTDVSNASDWRSTMMGNSAKDPLWQAKVSSEIARHPEAKEHIEEICVRCHMPMAYTQTIADGETPEIFGDGYLDEANPLHEAALGGVSCTVCHQIQPDNLGTEASFSGNYVIDKTTAKPNRDLFGPYDVDATGVSIMRPGSGYQPVYGEHLSGSKLCAACHTLFTPFTDAQGQPGQFPEQAPYLEWLHSIYGDGLDDDDQSCQECHLPDADGAVTLFPGQPARQPFAKHHFVGGNVFVLKILQANVTELGLSASTDQFETTIQRTLAQLQNNTAELTINSVSEQDGVLQAVVEIENKAGHKLPSGYPSRRVWIHLTVTDGDGNFLFDSGRPLPHGGVLDNDADLAPAAFEPHYTTITQPDQVQIYETIMGDIHGEITQTLVEAAVYIKDNRLLPHGFDKSTADADVALHGAAATDADFVGGGDSVTYEIDIAGHDGPFTVRAELLYSSVSYGFVQDLRTSDTPEVARFSRYYDEADKTPVVIDSAEVTLP